MKMKKKVITKEQGNGSFFGIVQETEDLHFRKPMLSLFLWHRHTEPPASRVEG